MLTQCPGCQTVFRITGAILRAAHGQVRCGRCNTQFDAIEYLQEEERPVESAEIAPASAASEGEQVTAEFAPTPFDPAAVQHEEITLEGNRIEISGVYRAAVSEKPVEEHTRTIIEEFNIGTEEWQNPFDQFDKSATELDPDEAASAEALSKALESLEPEEDRIELTAEPEAESNTADSDGEQEIEVLFEPQSDSVAPNDDEQQVATTQFKPDTVPPITYAHVPEMEHIASESVETIEYAAAPEEIAPAPQPFNEFIEREPKPRRWPWVVLSVLLIAALIAQVLHHYRQELVRHPSFGPQLARVYALFGQTLEPRWDLAAYTIKQWGIVSDPQAPGTLRVRASITNNANFAQPYPLLKLRLEDRFGANLGSREFKPEEYLPSPTTATRRITAGTAANVDLAIVDPGEDAVGFQFDVCLQDAALHCAHDAAGS